jgi:hypothetical protein
MIYVADPRGNEVPAVRIGTGRHSYRDQVPLCIIQNYMGAKLAYGTSCNFVAIL